MAASLGTGAAAPNKCRRPEQVPPSQTSAAIPTLASSGHPLSWHSFATVAPLRTGAAVSNKCRESKNECREGWRRGERLLQVAGLFHLAQFALELGELIAQAGGELEFELTGGLEHL